MVKILLEGIMKTDLYTKIVLTVIAVCLVIIVFRGTNLVSVANAGTGDPVPVVIRGIDEASYLRWEAINVEVTNWP